MINLTEAVLASVQEAIMEVHADWMDSEGSPDDDENALARAAIDRLRLLGLL